MSMFNIPESIRGCRIGSSMDSLTRSLKPYTMTFDPQKLSGANLLRFINGTGELICQANSSSSEFLKNSIFSLDAKAEAGFYGCAASLGFNMELTSKSASKQQGINCFVSYVYKGQKIQLLYDGTSPETLYNCMSNDFQELYRDIMNAKTNEEYMEQYNKFTERYGHGCVTALHLTAGSVFMINITYSNEAEANSLRFGGSVAVNTPYGGGSVASSWGKEVGSALSNATMSVTGKNIPENTPTASWCSAMVDKFANQGVSILCQPAGMISVPDTNNPKSPELPERRNPDNKKIPSPVNTDSNLTKELKDKIMQEDGYKDWNKYIEAQKDAYEKLTPSNIVKDAIKVKKINSDSTLKSIYNSDKEILNLHKNTDNALGSDSWDLGGYIPYAYEITPWSVLFPDLKLKLPQSFTSIYYAKIFTYYLTRLQLSQYLYFLHDLGRAIEKPGGCSAISFDADIYNNHCKDLLEKITGTDEINKKVYSSIVEDFERSIQNDNTFNSYIIYENFYKMYDFINCCQYGFVSITIDQYNHYTYRTIDGERSIAASFNITSLLKDALRVYFIIGHKNNELKLGFFHYTDHMQVRTWPKEMFKDIYPINEDGNGRKYIKYVDTALNVVTIFYAVSSKDVPDSEFAMRGLPMFQTFPFDDIREFANPDNIME